MFPLSLFLIKIKFKKPTETEQDLFTALLSSGLMALGKEGQGHGALLTPLDPGHPGQAALPKPKEQYLPGWSWPCPGVTKEPSSDLKPLWTRKYLSLRLSPQHHPVCDPPWHSPGPRRTLPSPPKCCRTQESAGNHTLPKLSWGGWRGSRN